MDYRQFIEYCGYTQDLNPDWRPGQTHFNALYTVNPGLADYIRGTAIDPFYRDDAIQPFLVMVWGYATAFGSVKDERPSSNL